MRLEVGTLAAMTLALAIAGPCGRAFAYDDAVSVEAARRFDRFLDDHPWVGRDLQRDPSLANDRSYIEDHRSLREFLDEHPDVRRELQRDPYAVLRREHRIEREERRGREITHDEMDRFQRFLHEHPAVARDLRGDPSLASSRKYLGEHPSFRDFLRDHPAIRQELQDNPYAFMRHVERSAEARERPEKRGAKPR